MCFDQPTHCICSFSKFCKLPPLFSEMHIAEPYFPAMLPGLFDGRLRQPTISLNALSACHRRLPTPERHTLETRESFLELEGQINDLSSEKSTIVNEPEADTQSGLMRL